MFRDLFNQTSVRESGRKRKKKEKKMKRTEIGEKEK